MRILVPVAEVATVSDDFATDGEFTDIDERYLTYDLNEWDEYSIEAAVQVSEEHDDVEVVTATIGPERCEETIRMALAKGADRAIRIWDDALADRDQIGLSTKVDVLRAVVEEEEPDLVFTGVQTADASFGATGMALAEQVGYTGAAVVNNLSFDPGTGVVHVHRELEGGVEGVVDVETPAVLSIQTGLNEPRYASLRGIRQAQSKELDVRDCTSLGVDADAGDAVEFVSMHEPEADSEVTVLEGSADDAAADLGDLLADKGVIDG